MTGAWIAGDAVLPALHRVAVAVLAGAVGVLVGACHPVPAPVAPPAAAGGIAVGWSRWRTLRAEHVVTVEARTAQGTVERRRLRGVIAVERPARMRLRALGPGGLTLFDILYVDGQTRVIESIRDPHGAALSRLLDSIGADLALAYDLEPRPAGRTFQVQDGEIVGSEPGQPGRPARTVRHGDFRRVPGGVAPARTVIDDQRGYRVTIVAGDTGGAAATVLDEPLDPTLFRP